MDAQQRAHDYKHRSEQAVQWLLSHLQSDGSYGRNADDLACYYKSPYLFHLSGRVEEACRMLTYIQDRFMQNDGDFVTSHDTKSENRALGEYWPYINGWLALTAQKIGRFDIAQPAYRYLKSFYHPTHGGFTTNQPYACGDKVVDVLSTAHQGLTSLYFGDIEQARSAGTLLQKYIAMQPDVQRVFYLRIDDSGSLITDFSDEKALFLKVSAEQPDQLYFMIGYPIAFLGKLYQAIGDAHTLDTAQRYLAFALQCRDHLCTFHYSHKVAWGAAIVAHLTGEARFADLAIDIVDYLLDTQHVNGGWLQDQPAHTSFDQTAEIAIWLREIATELSPFGPDRKTPSASDIER